MLVTFLSVLTTVSLLASVLLFFRIRQIYQLHRNSVKLCHRVANELSHRKDNESVVERMFNLVIEHTKAEIALLTYNDQHDGNSVRIMQIYGIPESVLEPGTMLEPGEIGYGFGRFSISESASLYHEGLREAVLADTGIEISHRQNMMCLPIVSSDTTHGLLQLISSHGQPYSPGYLADLKALGVYMDAAIQNANKTDDIRRRSDAAQALFRIGLTISRFGELEEILHNAVYETHRLLDSDFSWYLALEDPKANHGTVRSIAGNYSKKIPLGLEIPLKGRTAVLVEMLRKQHKDLYVLIRDLESNEGEGPKGYTPPPDHSMFCDREIHETLRSLGVRSAIIVPVGVNGIPRGLLCSFKSSAACFDNFQVMLQRRIANQLLIAINTADYHKKIRQLALAKERQRISNELHDDMAQVINGMSLELHSFTKLVEKGADKDTLLKRLDSIRPLLDQAKIAIREGISELRIPEGRNFWEILAEFIIRFERSHHFNVHIDLPDRPLTLSARVQRELIRIAQESLLNVYKHSGSRKAWIKADINPDSGNYELQIMDKGIGAEQAGIKPGQGIMTMYDRARRINAVMEILPNEAEGLTVTIEIPPHGK
jgi:signal transduction histidine kinase